jgi:hypothetical protein
VVPLLEPPTDAHRRGRGSAERPGSFDHDRALPAKAREALRRLRDRKRLRSDHDWLVVTGLGEAAELELEPEPPEPLELGPELFEPPVLPEPPDVEPAEAAVFERELELAAAALCCTTAGCLLETSCTKMTPHARAKMDTDAATTRLRTSAARRRRACRRSATSRLFSGVRDEGARPGVSGCLGAVGLLIDSSFAANPESGV